MPLLLEGVFHTAQNIKVGIVVSRWNEFITNQLLDGAVDTLTRHGVADDNITIAYCPGSYELPFIARELALTNTVDVVICLGCVIRGATTHYDYVANQAASGIASVGIETRVPVIFGVVTTETIEQAIERSGTKAGNKGAEAAKTAIEVTSLVSTIRALQS